MNLYSGNYQELKWTWVTRRRRKMRLENSFKAFS